MTKIIFRVLSNEAEERVGKRDMILDRSFFSKIKLLSKDLEGDFEIDTSDLSIKEVYDKVSNKLNLQVSPKQGQL